MMRKAAMAILPAALTTAIACVPQAQAQSLYMTKSHITASRQHASQVSLPQGTEYSTNWCGYVVTPSIGSSAYTSVAGSWIVPKISGTPSSLGSQWIGLGGVNSSDLLQMGTVEQVKGRREVATLFWEKLPASAQYLVTVPVGAKIAANISTQDGSNWSLDFHVTEPNGQTVDKHVSVTLTNDYAAGIGTSAEWISEDPSNQNGKLYPLANTGVVQFTQDLVNGQPLGSSANQIQPVALVTSSGRVRMAPSELDSGGTSFSTISLKNPLLSVWNTHRWEHFRLKVKFYHGHVK